MTYLDEVVLLVAKREDEEDPYVIGCMPRTTWEVYAIEEWDEWKRETAKRFFDADWTAYDYTEAVITLQPEHLKALFDVRDLGTFDVRPQTGSEVA